MVDIIMIWFMHLRRAPTQQELKMLDAGTPTSCTGSTQTGIASPSQSSLSSLGALVTATSTSTGIVPPTKPTSRCLSPLLIPPPRTSISDGSPAPPASPLGSLQPDLYLRRDGPLFLSARRTGKCMGRLHLRLSYDFDKSDLHVHLIEAHDLAGTDQGGNDPNPFFDQHFRFPVFDYDRYSRNDVVGSVRVAMEELELVSSTSPVEVWGEIAREKKAPEDIQQVLVSLSYLPSAERLTVMILKARNLFPPQKKRHLGSICQTGAININIIESLKFDRICVLDASSEMSGNSIVGSCIVDRQLVETLLPAHLTL
ncbi:hypothetical protein G9C98_005347 [Cotesia typhae]|uniref:C2 domain-containing protein n=1 Tax=Cotesia typhae TaxID=2053667 RepID=A0A8J5VD39_9HYME|nr:hypothetical protein G9C98_005347 [Cotesia typhae]